MRRVSFLPLRKQSPPPRCFLSRLVFIAGVYWHAFAAHGLTRSDKRELSMEKAHLEDENAALKLRLEGQRRAIHELEHQANILREDARLR